METFFWKGLKLDRPRDTSSLSVSYDRIRFSILARIPSRVLKSDRGADQGTKKVRLNPAGLLANSRRAVILGHNSRSHQGHKTLEGIEQEEIKNQ